MILYNLLVDLTSSSDVSVNCFDIFFQRVHGPAIKYFQYSQMNPVCLCVTYSNPFCCRVTVLSDLVFFGTCIPLVTMTFPLRLAMRSCLFDQGLWYAAKRNMAAFYM
jgi:hypothetical protein